jgi:CTP synthase (UTP-ammonia lyase)
VVAPSCGVRVAVRDTSAAEIEEPAGVDVADDQPRIMRMADHPYFVLTLFVPQTSSAPGTPHPLVTALLSAAVDAQAQLHRS